MTWTKMALVVVIACLPASATDDTCTDPLFSCVTARGKFIRICSVEEEVGRRWSQIQYRFGTIEKPELVYPADADKGAPPLFFSHESKKGLYEVTVRFTNGGYTYRVFSVADDKGDGAAGVTVSSKNGKLLSTVACIERPYIFPSYLQRALPCDMTNPNGKAACQDRPYQAKGR